MIIISLIVILIGLFSYTIGTMFRFMKSTGTQGKEEFRKKTVELLLRVGFIAANVTSTVVVSIILIN